MGSRVRGGEEPRGVGIWICGQKRHFIPFGNANNITGSRNNSFLFWGGHANFCVCSVHRLFFFY